MRGIVRRGFLKPSSSIRARGCSPESVHCQPSPEVMHKGGVVSLTLPVSSLALVVRDDGHDGDFPLPYGDFSPCHSFGLGFFCVENICFVLRVSCDEGIRIRLWLY